MALRIVIGFSRPGCRGSARPVYVGDSGAEAEAARASAPDASFLVLNNPVGVRKNGKPPIVISNAPPAATEEPADEKTNRRRR